MKNIRILHLFPELLSLYGEYGNLQVLIHFLRKNGFTAECVPYEEGELSLEGFGLIYIGSGTEANIREAAKRLMPYKDIVKAAVKDNKLFLATGNSMAIFGECIEAKSGEFPALGIFPYKTKESEKRFIGDALTKDAFGSQAIGFINTSYIYEGINTPLFELVLNRELGNDKRSPSDGFCEKNFFATQLTGPLTVKNPHLLCHFIKLMTNENIELSDSENIVKAYSNSLAQLRKRV